jgi:hypothetical protein
MGPCPDHFELGTAESTSRRVDAKALASPGRSFAFEAPVASTRHTQIALALENEPEYVWFFGAIFVYQKTIRIQQNPTLIQFNRLQLI